MKTITVTFKSGDLNGADEGDLYDYFHWMQAPPGERPTQGAIKGMNAFLEVQEVKVEEA